MIISIKGKTPKLGNNVYVSENATLIGDITIGEESSVWFGSVLRADVNKLVIGKRTNIQDLSAIHLQENHDTIIGDDVTIGHRAIIHGCHIGNRCLIGMGATIMNGVTIGEDCIIGAGALVTEGTVVPPKTLVIGFPAKPKRTLTEDEIKSILTSAKHYASNAKLFMN